MSNNPTPTPSADIHAAPCPICKGRGFVGGYPGIYRTCICKGGPVGDEPSNEPDFQSDATKLAALQSEIAQLRADLAEALKARDIARDCEDELRVKFDGLIEDLATATPNAAKAQDTINGQARELEGLRAVVEAAKAWNLARIERYRSLPAPAEKLHALGKAALDLIDALAAISPAKQGGGKDE